MEVEDSDYEAFMRSTCYHLAPRGLEGQDLYLYHARERYRSRLFTRRKIKEMDPEDLKRLESFINLHIKLDLEVQRLAAFINKRRALQDSMEMASKERLPKEGVKAQVQTIKDQLNALEFEMQPAREIIFNTSCSIFLGLADFPDGKLKERLKMPHAHNDWIEWHCRGRGGCCANMCGCCSKPREGIDIKGIGHCTSACVCCKQRREAHTNTSDGPLGMEMKIVNLADSKECLGLVDLFIGHTAYDDFGYDR
ncbi:hypothetical protein P170DRAFT_143042 [Aspergillus steynii IBT 23096]|uniref:Uncharacterized protein n=1 Tax=Aspergillus steynii IBT 23096 TaxID=1392250 RepID=A0A2I2GBX8_9EURO|nr:uncharacterized protein P170DRAFT_143042 [Aspergillus steynii IBT 23096]PLB50388.1 hypothetical protein P170DRAFT_143042 [Aspergillus steynii IBT 23096]